METKHHHPHRYHRLRRVLHPNRYFIWAIVLIVLVGASLSAYIYISSYNSNPVDLGQDQRRTYADRTAGYSAVYPAGWQLEADQQGNITFENPANNTESITVVPAALTSEKVIRSALNIVREYDYSRGNIQYEILVTAKRDRSMDISVAFVKTPAKLYYIYGHSGYFSEFVTAFRVIANQPK